MKKFTLVAGMAIVALGAAAQSFTMEDGSVKAFADKYGKGTYYNINMSELSAANLKAQGNTVVEIGPDETTRFLYVWEGTFIAGTPGTPAPGWDEENMDFAYTSLTVGTVGWSGAGWNINDGHDIPATFSENTRFHMCYSTNATAPAGVAVQLLNDAVKLSCGRFDQNIQVAPAPNDDWQTIDISFSDIKKLVPGFTYPEVLSGNFLVLLAGGVNGTNIAVDNCFFYTPGDGAAIEGVEADNANAPVEYFNLQGVKVANPENGLFIKVQGNKAEKVVL